MEKPPRKVTTALAPRIAHGPARTSYQITLVGENSLDLQQFSEILVLETFD